MGRRAEGVCLDDVGAAADVFGVNLLDEIGITEIQLVVAAIDVDALGVEHGTHRAVHDVDAIGVENISEGVHRMQAWYYCPGLTPLFAGRLSEIKKPRAKQRDFKISFEVFRAVSFRRPSCLAVYFTWPQVALTHHAFHRCLYASPAAAVKF